MNRQASYLGVRACLHAFAFIGSALLAHAAQAQDRTLSEREVTDQLDATLPAWDGSVLDVKDGADWSAQLDFEGVLKALGERPLRAPASTDERRVTDGTRVLRLTKERGNVRFVERARTWDSAQTATKPVEPSEATKLTLTVLERLGVPRAELGSPRVDLQLGLDEALKQPTDSKQRTMYSLVSVARKAGQLEVYGSRARVAVTNAGGLQRLRLTWPTFRLATGLSVRERKLVVQQAVKAIMQQQASPLTDMKFIQARLAYVPELATLPYVPRASFDETPVSTREGARDADDDVSKLGPEKFGFAQRVEPVQYVPAVVISVAASPTPYELLIPVAD